MNSATHARALKWLETCARRDNATVQLCLGLLLLFNAEVRQDVARAAACLQLGILHARGEQTPQDYAAAARFYAQAAELGEAAG